MTLILFIYLIAGLLFGVWFLFWALPEQDTNAVGAGWGFRLMVFPCCLLFWPFVVLVYRTRRNGRVGGQGWLQADRHARAIHAAVWKVLPWLIIPLLFLSLYFRKSI